MDSFSEDKQPVAVPLKPDATLPAGTYYFHVPGPDERLYNSPTETFLPPSALVVRPDGFSPETYPAAAISHHIFGTESAYLVPPHRGPLVLTPTRCFGIRPVPKLWVPTRPTTHETTSYSSGPMCITCSTRGRFVFVCPRGAVWVRPRPLRTPQTKSWRPCTIPQRRPAAVVRGGGRVSAFRVSPGRFSRRASSCEPMPIDGWSSSTEGAARIVVWSVLRQVCAASGQKPEPESERSGHARDASENQDDDDWDRGRKEMAAVAEFRAVTDFGRVRKLFIGTRQWCQCQSVVSVSGTGRM